MTDESRSGIYKLMSQLFDRELSLEFVRDLQKTGLFELLQNVDSDFTFDTELDDFENLQAEYARLFVGPGPQVPPYASIYRKDDEKAGQFWGETTGEVKRFMAFYGLDLEKSGTIPDHISILFEFMEKVIRAKITASQAGDNHACLEADKIQKLFFRNYIQPWVERFFKQVLKVKPNSFYTAVVKFADQFIAEERTTFN